MNDMYVNHYGKQHIIGVELNRYVADNTLYIELWCDTDGFPEPFATLTTCLDITSSLKPEYRSLVKDNVSFLDTNNCPWAIEFVKEYKLGKPTTIISHSGYCTYPLYEWDLDALKKYELHIRN